MSQAQDSPLKTQDSPIDSPPEHITDQEVFDAMEAQGGGFVAHLGAAWRRADAVNSTKLHAVFGHYFNECRQSIERDRASR